MSKHNGTTRQAGQGLVDLVRQVVGQMLPNHLAAALDSCQHHQHAAAAPALLGPPGGPPLMQAQLLLCCRCGRGKLDVVTPLQDDGSCGPYISFSKPNPAAQLVVAQPGDVPLPPPPQGLRPS